MAENPYLKYAGQTAPQPSSDNPYLKYAPQQTPQQLHLDQFSKDDLMNAYKALPRDDPRRNAVRDQIVQMGGEPFDRGIMSKQQAQVAGITDAASLGMSDEINAGIAGLTGGRISPLGGKTYDEELKLERDQLHNAQKDDPGHYADGQIAGMAIQALPTFGASIPDTMLGRAAVNIGGGALQGGLYSGASNDGSLSDRAGDAAGGALAGGIFGALPTVGEGIWKGGKAIISGGVKNVQKVTNPEVAAEKDLVQRMVADRRTQGRLDKKALARGKELPQRRFLTGDDALAAEGAGQRTMVSDFGGDVTRDRLKAAGNISPDAMTEMRGNASLRQGDQGPRMTEVIGDTFGDTLNPKTVRDELNARARDENDAAYTAAESHPNAAHLWNPVLQGAISSSAGKEALKKAISASRDEAIRNGHEIIEPIFHEGPDGLMTFSGQFRRPTGELVDGIQGVGLGLRFWDHVKRGFDEVIEGLPVTAKTEAARIRSIKNNMVANLDQSVPEYAHARGTAKDYFGMEDAHEAGAEYFKNMNAYDTAEARHALGNMKPASRELFARGYAAELVNRITQMGQAEDVNKLFKSTQSRMKMRDALGNSAADNLEAYTHREMVQGLLGKHLGSNSTTAAQAAAMDGMKASAAGAGAGIVHAGASGILPGILAGLAVKSGYRFAQRHVLDRYARAMAELATADDPETIARILSKVSKDSGYMDFSRAVSSGAGAASRVGGAATGSAPRFADGGRVPFGIGGIAEKVIEEAGRVGRSTVAHPVRKAFPGIYKAPADLLKDVQVAPEDPALKQLFGVTRDDLYEMSKRKGNVSDILGIADKPSRGSPATDNVKTPRNAQRLVSALEAARSNEGLWKGMHGWYTMDPAYHQLVADYGPEEGGRMFQRLNTLTGMSSPGSEVMTELQRGTAANMMNNLGRFDEFLQHGGTGKEIRGQGFPQELAGVDGHPYHSTSQAPAMDNYIRTGKVEMGSAKVPTYIGASTPPELGNFTDLPVADAHFTRALGLPDTRTAEKVYDHSMSMGEYKALAPWYRDRVASQAGIESVPAQAIHWGLFGPQTGVTTPVGSPKLELLARGIMETARRLGVSPEKARDLVLSGKAHAYRDGGFVSALAAAA